MKIPREKPELVVSKEKNRHLISAVNLRIDEKTVGRGKSGRVERTGWLEATDSYRAVRVPVELGDEDTAGLINPLALTAARKNKTESIDANGAVVVAIDGGQMELARPEGTYPNLPEILKFDGEPVFSIGINADLLVGLAQALGANKSRNGVRLDFYGPLEPIKVTFKGAAKGSVAVLMPVRLT